MTYLTPPHTSITKQKKIFQNYVVFTLSEPEYKLLTQLSHPLTQLSHREGFYFCFRYNQAKKNLNLQILNIIRIPYQNFLCWLDYQDFSQETCQIKNSKKNI